MNQIQFFIDNCLHFVTNINTHMSALNTSTVVLWFCLGKTCQCHWSGRYSITKSLIFQACQRGYVILYVKCLCICAFINNFKSVFFWRFKLMVHMFDLLRPPYFNLPVLVNLFSSAKNCVPSSTVMTIFKTLQVVVPKNL